MVSEARKRANAKYNREKMVQRVVRFSPNERELLAHLDAQPNKAGYLKRLIREDMEHQSTKKGNDMNAPKSYTFASANIGDIEITISGEYTDGSVDLEAYIPSINAEQEWTEIDPGSVEEIFEWLIGKGVEFESDRSLWFNYAYVSDVMIDRCRTEAQLLDEAAGKSAGDLRKWREFHFGD